MVFKLGCKPICNSIKSRFDNFRTGPKSDRLLESGARDLHTRGTGARAAEGMQGAANRATLSDISPPRRVATLPIGETLVNVILLGRVVNYFAFARETSHR